MGKKTLLLAGGALLLWWLFKGKTSMRQSGVAPGRGLEHAQRRLAGYDYERPAPHDPYASDDPFNYTDRRGL